MKIVILSIIAFAFSLNVVIAQQSYYNDVNLTLEGIPLKNELAQKIISTHSQNLSYSDAREALKIIDLNPGQTNNVLLVYGFTDGLCPGSSSSDNDHRRRNKNDFGGGANCEWNREHTYPKSLGTPNLGTSGPGADAHMLRASDVQRNGQRGSKKFSDGSGNSDVIGSNWYPGDEWKGDAARIMMYMYLRYGNQCLPKNVGVGSIVANDANMITLFLEWNIEDPVSQIEINRNSYLGNSSNEFGQGNRNPFIDNPYLATRIWGGNDAQDIWGIYLGADDLIIENNINVFPNPVKDVLTISSTSGIVINNVVIYTISGKLIREKTTTINQEFKFKNLPNGFYFAKITTEFGVLTKKIVVDYIN